MFKVVWTNLAVKELDDILKYLEDSWGENSKNVLLKTIKDCITKVHDNFLHFAFVNKKLEIQKCLVTKHNTILFNKTDKTITILRFFLNKRNPENI